MRALRLLSPVLVVLIGFGLAQPVLAQDMTTQLALFLRDLRNGTLGVVNTITSLKTATVNVDTVSFPKTASDVSLSRGAANRLDLASGDSFNIVSGDLSFTSPTDVKMQHPGTGRVLFTNGTTDYLDIDGALSTITVKSNMALAFASKAIFNTAPTVTSAGTSPSVTVSNGTASFRVNVGTGGTATTIVMAMPAATTGWNCYATNITGAAANRANQHIVQQASTTTSATLQNQTISTGVALAFTASDIVAFLCTAH